MNIARSPLFQKASGSVQLILTFAKNTFKVAKTRTILILHSCI